jgi:hypothetical protein
MDLNKDRLRAAYEEAVAKIGAERNASGASPHGLLNGPLYKQMQELVFETAFSALIDTVAPFTQPRMHVLSALPGTGKSTFSNAWAAAIVACGGSVLFVVEQMETADQRYRDLNKLLPGKVAVWSTDHRKGNHSPSKVKSPAAQFHKNELKNYPVAVCTHEGYKHDERRLFRDWKGGRRTFFIIDEMVKEVTQYVVNTETIARAVNLTNGDEHAPPEAIAALDKLHGFLVPRTQKRVPIDTLSDQAARELVDTIAWFTTTEAEHYAEGKEVLTTVFGFAKCLIRGWAFIATDGIVTLTGYDNNLQIEHGTMQLDGTAKLGGYEQLGLPDRKILSGPVVSFGQMRTVIEKPPTKMHLAKFLTKADNYITYRNWMIDVIKRHAQPGQKVLVVCKKTLVDMKQFPAWDHDSPNWRRLNYTTDFKYDLPLAGAEAPNDPSSGVAHVSVQWWGGPSTGHNAWQEADAVFLFDANWTPRHKVLADMQGLYRVPANTAGAPIAEMGSLRKQSDRFRDYKLRCMMAAHVQAACRGNLRRWDYVTLLRDRADTEGSEPLKFLPTCGKQLLVCGLSDDQWLWENWGEMFPGAPAPVLNSPNRASAPKGKGGGYKQDWAGRLRELLTQPGLPHRISTRWIGEQWGVLWRNVQKQALAALPALETAGWAYQRGRGRAPSVFVKA